MAEKEVGSLAVKLGMNTAEFKEGVTLLSTKMKLVSQDFKNASGGLDKVSDASKISALHVSELTSKIELQRKFVERQRETYEKMSKTLAAGSNQLLGYELRVKKSEGALQDLETALKQATAEVKDEGQALNKTGDEAKTADNKMDKLHTTMTNMGKGIKVAAVGIAAAGVALAALGAGLMKTVSVAADFEQELSNIKAVTGATAEEMDKLHDAALKAGADTVYSATEAAQGMDELLKAGLTVEQVLNGGLNGALTLAAAGGIELADAATIASTALNAFKDDNLSVASAADILAGAANASATDVAGLSLGLSQSAAVAAGMGMSFKDTATALATFAQNGLKGSDAGTSLKTMLMNLQPVTDKQVGLFKDLNLMTKEGTSAFYDAAGSMRPLNEISGLLKTSMAGLTDAQRATALETMFGSDAIRAGNILFREGADGVNKMAAAMDKVKAADVAAERMNNLKGVIESLKGSLETIVITIGEKLLPGLSMLGKDLTNAINEGDWSKVGDAISGGLTLILDQIVSMLPELVKVGAQLLEGIISTLVAAIPKVLPSLMDAFVQIVNTLINVLAENGPELVKSGINALMKLIDGLVSALPALIDVTITLIMALVNGLIANLPKIMDAAVKILLALVDGILVLLPQLIPAAIQAIVVLAQGLIDALPKLIEKLPMIITTIIDVIVDNLPLLIDAAVQIIVALTTALIQNYPLMIKAGIQIMGAVFSGIISAIVQVFAIVPKFVESMKSALMGINWGELGTNIMNGIIDGVVNAAKNLANAVVKAAKAALDAVKKFLGIQSPSTVMRDEVGAQVGAGMAEGITKSQGLLTKAMSGMQKVTVQSATNSNFGGQVAKASSGTTGNVTVQNMYVRNDSDIKKVAQELFNLQRSRGRAVGVTA